VKKVELREHTHLLALPMASVTPASLRCSKFWIVIFRKPYKQQILRRGRNRCGGFLSLPTLPPANEGLTG
jgi:hypothetical protein